MNVYLTNMLALILIGGAEAPAEPSPVKAQLDLVRDEANSF